MSEQRVTVLQDIVIQASGLTKRYGAQDAVRDVSFEVRRGDVFGFLGPNGSGKSTTIGILLGLIEPTAGSIDLFGLGREQRAEALARVGAIVESPAFYPYLTGYDNLRALAHLRQGVSRARVAEVLEIVGLADAAGKRFGTYSLGMKQRLGIGWTLMHDPELLVLDEPTNGLDPAGMQEVRHLIVQLAERGKTIFISSHLLNEVEQVCDRVAIIQRGRLIAAGTVAELVNASARLLIRSDTPRRVSELLRPVGGVERVEECGPDVVVVARGVRPALLNARLVGAGVYVDEFKVIQQSLEERFLEITGTSIEAEA
jgi:ABC-2 type transport system ATP-binding protein